MITLMSRYRLTRVKHTEVEKAETPARGKDLVEKYFGSLLSTNPADRILIPAASVESAA